MVSAGRWSGGGRGACMGSSGFGPRARPGAVRPTGRGAASGGAGAAGRHGPRATPSLRPMSNGMVGDEAAPARRDPVATSRRRCRRGRPRRPTNGPSLPMRILITNDDGVFAPGIAELARGLHAAFGVEHDLMVVAPLTDHSGASAAVGPVYERESIPYEHVDIPGLADVPTFGIDGSPALSVILALHRGLRTDARHGRLGHQPRDQRRSVGPPLRHRGRGPDRRAVRRQGPGRLHRLGQRARLLGHRRRTGLRDRAGPGRGRAGNRAEPQRAGGGAVRPQGTAPRHPRPGRAHPGGPARAHADAGGRAAVDRTGGAIVLALRGVAPRMPTGEGAGRAGARVGRRPGRGRDGRRSPPWWACARTCRTPA